jgi:aspartyl-tRNA synthetase
MAFMRRTHTCGELRAEHVGQVVVLNGWVNTYRGQSMQVFVDVRDRYGLTQVVFDKKDHPDLFRRAQELRSEYVVAVKGTVTARLPGKENPKLATGAIEVTALEVEVLNKCPTPPFEVAETPEQELANEDLRLQYRYLDLRRPTLQQTLILRHKLCKIIRDFLDREGFLELETPLLGKSTPEGARDYLVPSRVFPGNWYALPQSPQLYKQLLMIAGYDKYFQIARCLRDEDLRANRQPEFTQLDLEMAFVEMDDVLGVIERLTVDIFAKLVGVTIPTPLPRLKYSDAMLRYGSDKPDLRYGMEIVEVSDLAKTCEFNVFRSAVEAPEGRVRGLNAKAAAAKFSRKGLDELQELVRQFGAKGLAWTKIDDGKFNGGIAAQFTPEMQKLFIERMKAENGDLLLFVAATEDIVAQSLGALRTQLAATLKLYDPSKPDYKVAWVIDFPMFTWDKEEQRWAANHHPFTAPMNEDVGLLATDPGKARAKAYDLVINGDECGGGSIRIHDRAVQSQIFTILGMSEELAKQRFGFLLDALTFGAPPHGGIALGLDRYTMMLARTSNIRDVIAFPKNQKARDLMTGAPAPVDAKQLKELGL